MKPSESGCATGVIAFPMNPADTEDCGPLRIVGARDFEFAGAVDAFDRPLDYKFGWLQGSRKLLKGKNSWLRGPATIRIV
jgi:hypothetical protein